MKRGHRQKNSIINPRCDAIHQKNENGCRNFFKVISNRPNVYSKSNRNALREENFESIRIKSHQRSQETISMQNRPPIAVHLRKFRLKTIINNLVDLLGTPCPVGKEYHTHVQLSSSISPLLVR